MPVVSLKIHAFMDAARMRRMEKDAQERFQKMGQMAGEELTKGIEKAAPRVRRAMNSAANATIDYARKTSTLTKAQQEQAKASDRVLTLSRRISDQYARNADVAQEVADSETKLKDTRRALTFATLSVTSREANLRKKREEHAETTEELRKKELDLKDVRLSYGSTKAKEFEKTLMPLRRQNARETAYLAKKELELGQARVKVTDLKAQATKAEEDLRAVRQEHTSSVKDLDDAEKELVKTREAVAKQDEEIKRLNADVVRSNRAREESLRSLVETEVDAENKRSKAAGKSGHKKRGGIGVIGNMLTDLPFVPSGPAGAVMGGGIVLTMASAAEAAVTASQAMATLPAIATAAAAGIGTLALGMSGFMDTIKEVNDPEKFAEAIQGLSPAAQQAALEIQYLVQGPLKDLKNATQDTLFDGVAEQLHNFTNQLLPETELLTQGVAASLNNMFNGALGQLMTPSTQNDLNSIITNIVGAFQNLEPAIAPFVDAIVKITDTGSSFLPGFAQAVTNAANSFNNFITQAQADGSLANFIQQGIDAAVALKDVLVDVGKRIYDVFGAKSPVEFKQTLDSAVDAAFAVAQAIVGISHVVNDLLKFIQPVADALGGWENLIKVAGAAFLAWKTVGVFSSIAQLVTLLGVGGATTSVGGALAAIPGLAGAAATAIGSVAAAAAIGIPVAFNALGDYVDRRAGAGIPNGQTSFQANIDAAKAAPPPPQESAKDLGGLLGAPAAPAPPPPPAPAPVPAAPGTGPNPLAPGGVLGGQVSAPPGMAPPPQPASPAPAPGPSTAGMPGYNPFAVPAPPPDSGSGPSKSEQLDEIMSGMDPAQFMPPGGPVGGQPSMTTPGPGGFPVMGGGAQVTGAQGLQSGALNLASVLQQQFPELQTIGGWRPDGQGSSDHPSGNALDIMIPNWETEAGKALGDRINQFLMQNAGMLGVDSTIWRDQMQYASGESGGTVGGHQNHIHARTTQAPNANGKPPLMYGMNPNQPYDQKAGYGYQDVDPEQVRQAEQRLENERWDVGQARMMLEAKKKMGESINEIREAERKVAEEEAQYNEALLDLSEAQNGTWKDVNSSRSGKDKTLFDGMLDSDLGISKGIPGVVENMTKFLLSMAFAPMLGQMAMAGGMGPEGMGQPQYPYGSDPTAMGAGPGNFPGFGAPGSPQANANMIYQQAIQRGYTPQEAQAIVAYAIGESGLNAGADGGIQGGAGTEADRVLGLFQQKADFARGGGIDPSMRTDPAANTYAYLNQLEKNRHLPIEQALPATSVGGPLAGGSAAQPWQPLMNQAASYLGGAPGAAGPAVGGGPAAYTGGVPVAGGVPAAGPTTGSYGGPGGFAQAFGPGQQQAQGPGVGAAATQKPVGAPVGGNQGKGGWSPQGGGVSSGGLIPAAAGAAGMAADVMAPGSGQAIQKGGQLAERAIKFGGQLAGIGVSGLMETFGLSDSVIGDPNKSWIGRLAGGLSQMKPAEETTAGQTKAPVEPQQHQGAQGQPQQQGGPTVHIENFTQAENRNGQQAAQDLAFQAWASKGKR